MDIDKDKELVDVEARLVSILTDDVLPSNRQGVVIKSVDCLKFHKIEKFDDIKGELEVIAMVSNYKDTDGEHYSDETVEKAADWFAGNVPLNSAADENHSFEILDGIQVTRTWTEKKDGKTYWKLKYNVSKNEDMMEKARQGRITGVSIAGLASYVKKSREDGVFDRLLKALADHFEPKEIETKKEEEDKMEKSIDEILKAVEEKLPEMLEGIKKAESEKDEVKKAESDRVEKEKASEVARKTQDEKIEKLQEDNKILKEANEKLVKSVKDLEDEVLKSSQDDEGTATETKKRHIF